MKKFWSHTRVVDADGKSYNSISAELRIWLYAARGFVRCLWCWALVSPLVASQFCPNCGSAKWQQKLEER